VIGVDVWSSPEIEWIQSTPRFMAAEARELRLRRAIGLGRRALAALLSIPIETYRPWDSG
jgi:hypothetical protein